MQNKFLVVLLLASTVYSPVFAQSAETPAVTPAVVAQPTVIPTVTPTKMPTLEIEVKPTITPVVAKPLPEAKLEVKNIPTNTPVLNEKDSVQPQVDEVKDRKRPSNTESSSPKGKDDSTIQAQDKTTFPGLKKPESATLSTSSSSKDIKKADPALSTASLETIQAENKRRLEEELKTTTLTGKDIVNFPNRPSLGSLELTTLPGINESMTTGPLPMAASVSNKDMPSEQLLGRITPEVFQEMADIERGNTFLKLQMEKEKLKTDLEKLKATYRQQRLDEISKREDVVRTRIKWWQEQEKIRLEIEKKKLEEEALTREIAEQKAMRDQLRAEASARQANAANEVETEPTAEAPQKVEVVLPPMEELYTIESIRGLSNNLVATLKDRSTQAIFTVKRNDILPSGYLIKNVKSDSVVGAYGNRTDTLVFQPSAK